MRQRPTRRETLASLAGLAALSVPLAGCNALGNGGSTGGDGSGTDGTGGADGETDGSESGTDGSYGSDSSGDTGGGTGGAGPGSGGGDRFEDLAVGATKLAEGFTSPVAVTTPRPGRYYVLDQVGRIVLVSENSRTQVLDLRDRMVAVRGYSEQGLLGIALHPNFEANGRVFIRYSAPPRANTPDAFSHTFVLSEFSADTESLTIQKDTEQTLLEIPEPQSNHNAGDVAFGPDGYLYVPVGDGGAANDQGTGHVEDWYDPVGGGNGQDVTENLLGSMLRIDVDGADEGRPYAIPDDNPLVGEKGLDEHYAWGLRNPWKISFGPEGALYAADVGQNRFEEVSIVEKGGNYGWNVREATHCFRRDQCPNVTNDGQRLRDPIIEYGRGDEPVTGQAVVGGYRYAGEAVPSLEDHYVFADWLAGGGLFAAKPVESGLWPTTTVPVSADGFGPNVLSFGQDTDGELLVTTTAKGTVSGATGKLYRVTATE